MKKFFNLSLIALILTTSATSLTSCSKDDTAPVIEEPIPTETFVTIPDAELKGAIKEALKLTADEISEKDLLNLTALDLEGLTEVKDLTGLEKATNLTSLHLGETAVEKLDPIKGLKKITYLRINDTKIADLTPIKDYTELTYFNANTVPTIKDISALAKNKNLKELILREVAMGNAGMDVIKNFTKLCRLNIRETGVTDITVLGGLMQAGALLKTTPGAADLGEDAEIDLRDNEISSFTPIASYVENNTAITVSGYPKK